MGAIVASAQARGHSPRGVEQGSCRNRALWGSALKQKLNEQSKKAGIFPKGGLIYRSFLAGRVCLMGKKR